MKFGRNQRRSSQSFGCSPHRFGRSSVRENQPAKERGVTYRIRKPATPSRATTILMLR
jgi:hypothetical protein